MTFVLQYGMGGVALYMLYELLSKQMSTYSTQSELDRVHDASERKAEREHDGVEREKTRAVMLKMREDDHKAHMDALAAVLVKVDESAQGTRKHTADKLVVLEDGLGKKFELQINKLDELHKTQQLLDEKIKPMADMLTHIKQGVDGFPEAIRKEINETIPPFIKAIEHKIDEFMTNQTKEVNNGNI